VLEMDPLYLTGESDDQRPYSHEILVQFLTNLGYKIDKGATVRRKRIKSQDEFNQPVDFEHADDTTETIETLNDGDDETSMTMEGTSVFFHRRFSEQLPGMAGEFVRLMGNDAKTRIDDLSEEELVLMLKCLSLQAGFSEDKNNRFALIKYLLLL